MLIVGDRDAGTDIMYKVWMTNFNTPVYEGDEPSVAIAAAVRTGFECTMSHPGGMMSWSPISGWRTLYRNKDHEEVHG